MAPVPFVDAVRRLWAETVASFGLTGSLGALLARVEHDPELRSRFVQDPSAVLADSGVKLPAGMKVEVVENDEKTFHLVLPAMLEEEGAK